MRVITVLIISCLLSGCFLWDNDGRFSRESDDYLEASLVDTNLESIDSLKRNKPAFPVPAVDRALIKSMPVGDALSKRSPLQVWPVGKGVEADISASGLWAAVWINEELEPVKALLNTFLETREIALDKASKPAMTDWIVREQPSWFQVFGEQTSPVSRSRFTFHFDTLASRPGQTYFAVEPSHYEAYLANDWIKIQPNPETATELLNDFLLYRAATLGNDDYLSDQYALQIQNADPSDGVQDAHIIRAPFLWVWEEIRAPIEALSFDIIDENRSAGLLDIRVTASSGIWPFSSQNQNVIPEGDYQLKLVDYLGRLVGVSLLQNDLPVDSKIQSQFIEALNADIIQRAKRDALPESTNQDDSLIQIGGEDDIL